MRRSGLVEMLSGMHRDDEDYAARPLPEAQVETLKEIAARYAHCDFKVGDLVTPRQGFNVKGSGHPHIVVEVAPFDSPVVPTGEEAGSCTFGARYTMRVASLCQGSSYAAHWVEHWAFETYEP